MKITTLAPDASGLVEWPTLSANRKSVVTVGVFDGMHRGHQAVIRRAVELAKADKAFSVVVMFDPRPGVVHAYAAAHDGQEPGDGFCDPMALTSVDQRLRTLENLGVDHVLIVRYTLAFATKSYRFFLGQMVGKLGMRTLVLGTDAAMGANRAGDVKAIGVLAQATGVFELEIVDDRGPGHVRVPADVTPQMPSEPGEPVDPTEGMTKAQLRAWSKKHQGREVRVWSSTNVRYLLAHGRIKAADEILGHAHAIEGTVVHGEERGRTIGFPTANLGGMIDGYDSGGCGVCRLADRFGRWAGAAAALRRERLRRQQRQRQNDHRKSFTGKVRQKHHAAVPRCHPPRHLKDERRRGHPRKRRAHHAA